VANTNTPFGLKPFRGGGGYAWNEQGSVYSIPSTDGTAYYTYDIVKAAASSDANGVSNVIIAASTNAVRGSIVGIFPVYPGVSIQATPLALETPYIPATKQARGTCSWSMTRQRASSCRTTASRPAIWLRPPPT
jgi:hypothetical protein